jgi:deoxyribodipyrimidine photo-lyase
VSTRIVLLHRDLRLRDHPALAAAAAADVVVPLFVLDPALRVSIRRRRVLVACLADLRASLRKRGADLVIRRGDPVEAAMRVATEVGADGIELCADVSAYARQRERRLAQACAGERVALTRHAGVTLVAPGAVHPAGGDHYRVFTPYWRAWQRQPWRERAPTPRRLRLPAGIAPGQLPDHGPLPQGYGESVARQVLTRWAERAGDYETTRDQLDIAGTSRLSVHLHFGCVSPLSVASACRDYPDFLRQLCWRDFYHQVLAGFPELPHRAYRPGVVERWRYHAETLTAWQQGRTGVPIVDAGMRQLADEGYLPNRARLITASYLTKLLGLDWRDGARWYQRRLVDADVANNYGNWQWVAGTGNDTRPYRGFNPIRQAHRFDPHGDYVRRWVPELADLAGPAIHEPWRHGGRGYPPPLALARKGG